MYLNDEQYEAMYGNSKKKLIISVIVIAIFLFCLIISVVWIIKPEIGTLNEKDLLTYQDKIIEIEALASIYDWTDSRWGIELEDGTEIVITDSMLNYVEEDVILNMKPGKSIIYKIDKPSEGNASVEPVELTYDGELIFNIDDYNHMLIECRKSGWFLVPFSIFGIAFYMVVIRKCL